MVVKARVLAFAMMLAACTAPPSQDIQVTNIWAQPFDKSGHAAAVYMNISAKCTRPVILQSVNAVPPQQASLYLSRISDNQLKTIPLAAITVSCRRLTMLKPLGKHIIVTGIKKPVEIGDRLHFNLLFDNTKQVGINVEITSMAVLENVDPMHMHMKSTLGGMKGMIMR